MVQLKLSYIPNRNVKSYKSLWKTVCQFLEKLNIHSLYHPAIALVDIYPKEMKA